MSPIAFFNICTFLLAGWFAISNPVDEPAKRDPYFTPTEATSTKYMPQVIIRNMREDRAGNIWFATFGGPIRYDGKEFTEFSEIVGLAKTRIFSLTEDRSGALWFGSITGGASRFDGKSFTKFTAKEGLGNNDVMWVFEDRDANIWFGTGNGASRYDGKSMTNFTTKDGLVHNSVYTIAQDISGRMWFGTQGGICSYDGKSFANLADQVGRSFVNIRSTAVDRSGNLWFGGQEGAFRYDGKTLTSFTTEEGLLDDFVGSMIVDKAGNVWLGHPGRFPDGSGGGASRYDGKSFKHFTQRDGLSSKTVYCMLEDKAGNIWFGSADAGACRYDGKTFTNFSEVQPAQQPAKVQQLTIAKGETVSEMSKDLWYVFQGKNGHHWFGSRTEGAFRYDGKTITRFTSRDGLSGVRIGGIQEDKSGNIYFTTDEGISKFDGRSFTTLKPTPAVEWKKEPDDLWFGGGQDSGVVYRYDGKSLHRLAFPKTKAGDKHYVDVPRSKFPNAKYSPYDTYTIFKDSKGNLWFGTAVLGTCRYDGKSFTWISEEELRNGSFGTRSIIEDKDGKFWFSNTLHRYAIDRSAALGQGDASQWYKKEKGIGDFSGHKQGEYDSFMSSTLGDDGAMWMAILGGVVWRYDGKTMTQYPVTENGKHHWIFSIYKDNQGVLWLGTQAHGAYRFNGKTFEQFKP